MKRRCRADSPGTAKEVEQSISWLLSESIAEHIAGINAVHAQVVTANGKVVAVAVRITNHDADVVEALDGIVVGVADLPFLVGVQATGDTQEVGGAHAELASVEGAFLDGRHERGVLVEVGVAAGLAQLVVMVDRGERRLSVEAVELGDDLLERVSLDKGTALDVGVPLSQVSLARQGVLALAGDDGGAEGLPLGEPVGIGGVPDTVAGHVGLHHPWHMFHTRR